ncbi:MAG: hypothetical protein ACOC90_07955 [Bacteroidota bacterium]
MLYLCTNKRFFVVAVIAGLLLVFSGCGRNYKDSETIEVRGNFREPRVIEVTAKFGSLDEDTGNPEVTLKKEGEAVDSFKLGRKPVTLEVQIQQSDTPFRLIRGARYKGALYFTAEGEYEKKLPVNVYVKPWIVSNYWIVLAVLSGATVLFLANVICLIRLPPARGKVRMLPYGNFRYIYPPSRLLHFRRNQVTIGSGHGDDIDFVEDKEKKQDSTGAPYGDEDKRGRNGEKDEGICTQLKRNHFKLKFIRKQNEFICNIYSKTPFYYKPGESKEMFDVTTDSEPWRDYEIGENQVLSILEERGYKYASSASWRIREYQQFTVVIDRNCRFEFADR